MPAPRLIQQHLNASRIGDKSAKPAPVAGFFVRGRMGGMLGYNHIVPAIIATLIWAPSCNAANPQLIPLHSVVTTSGQNGLIGATAGYRDGKPVEEFGPLLRQILDANHFNGASNAFLVDAPSINDAMSASVGVLVGGRSALVPATLDMPNAPRGNHWLVVYLGVAGSGPVNWVLDSVSVETGRVQFNYHQHATGAETADINAYYYWVPLGKLDDGVCKLELYETGLKDVTLSRRVEIKSPESLKRTKK